MTKIKQIRKALNMTQRSLAEALQVPLSTVQKWDQGVRETPKHIIRLLQYLEKEQK